MVTIEYEARNDTTETGVQIRTITRNTDPSVNNQVVLSQ